MFFCFFFFFFLFFCCLFLFLCVFLATSLGTKPSLFVCCFVFFPFLSLLLIEKTVFPPRKGILCLFLSVSLCFSLASFWPPPFSIFLSLSLSFLLFFLPSCLSFLLSFASLFLSLSFLFFLLCFCFMKRTTSKYSITKFSFINIFSFFGFLSCFLFEIPFSYLCIFPDFKLCFLFTSMFLVSKNPS